MVGFKNTICALLLTAFAGAAVAQNNTNSPYTRYGYGDLVNPSFGNSKAMGGIAYGLRNGSQINPSNPASYTAIDSLTFILEGGFSLQNSNMSVGATKINAKNSSFDYLAMQFRLKPWMGMSLGLLPYSSVGYHLFQATPANEEQPDHTKTFTGDGGLHSLYVGVGVKPIKNLSVGVNVAYFWGEINRTSAIFYPSNSSAYSYSELTHMGVRDVKLDFGAQYTQAFGKKHSVTLGAVFSPKRNLNNDTYVETTSSEVVRRDSTVTAGTPNVFGIGATYTYDNRLTVGLDCSLQQWSKVSYMNAANEFCDQTRISLGAEYLPNVLGRSYLSHVKYRLGAYYNAPYYKLDNYSERATREYGVTAGFGLPLPRSRSLISITAQYVRVEALVPTAMTENVVRLSVGLTINERWFFKRRVE